MSSSTTSLVPATVGSTSSEDKGIASLDSLSAALAPAAGALFFLEARLLAGGAATAAAAGQQSLKKLAPHFVSQFGVVVRPVDGVGVTVFSKTGGVLLIAGVGSYCAYRLGRRMLAGRYFSPWTLYEPTACDLLARADSRLLHPASEGFYEVRVGGDDLNLLQKFFEAVDVAADTTRPSSSSASGPPPCGGQLLRRLAESVAVLRRDECGLAAICPVSDDMKTSRPIENDLDSIHLFSSIPVEALPMVGSDVYCRHDGGKLCGTELWEQDLDDGASISAASELTSVSRTQDGVALRLARRRHERQRLVETAETPRDDDAGGEVDLHSETASTSLQLTWQEEPFWDDEFAGDCDQNCASPTPSGISDLSAVRNLEAMFEDHERRDASIAHRITLARSTALPQSRTKISTPLHRRTVVVATAAARDDGAASTLSSRWDDAVLARCYDDNPGYLYQSAVVDRNNFAPSESNYGSETTQRGHQRDFYGNKGSEASRSIARRLRESASPHGRLVSEGLWELATTVSRDSRPPSTVSMGASSIGAPLASLPSILSRADVAGTSAGKFGCRLPADEPTLRAGKSVDFDSTAMFDSAIAMTESMSSSTAAKNSPPPVADKTSRRQNLRSRNDSNVCQENNL